MEKIKTIWIKDEMIPTLKEFEDIRWKEHKSFSELICKAMYEYVQKHKEEMIPAFFREKGDV